MFFSTRKSKYIVWYRVHLRKDPVRPDVDLRKAEELDLEEEFGHCERAPYSMPLWPVRSTTSTLNLEIDGELKPLRQVSVADLTAALHAHRKQLKVPSSINLEEIAHLHETPYLEKFVAADFVRFVDAIGEALFGPVEFKNCWMPSTVIKEQKGRVPAGRRLLKAEYIESFEFLCDYYGGILIDNARSGHLHWRQDLRNLFNGCATQRRKRPYYGYGMIPVFYLKDIFESKNVMRSWMLVIFLTLAWALFTYVVLNFQKKKLKSFDTVQLEMRLSNYVYFENKFCDCFKQNCHNVLKLL